MALSPSTDALQWWVPKRNFSDCVSSPFVHFVHCFHDVRTHKLVIFLKNINIFIFSYFPFLLPFGFRTIWMTQTRDFSFQPRGWEIKAHLIIGIGIYLCLIVPLFISLSVVDLVAANIIMVNSIQWCPANHLQLHLIHINKLLFFSFIICGTIFVLCVVAINGLVSSPCARLATVRGAGSPSECPHWTPQALGWYVFPQFC